MNLGEKIDSFNFKINALVENGELEVVSKKYSWQSYSDQNYYHHFDGLGLLSVRVDFWIANDGNRSLIILILCNKLNEKISPLCNQDEVQKLFEIYKQKYGDPNLLDRESAYFLLSVAYNQYNYTIYENLIIYDKPSRDEGYEIVIVPLHFD